jgi:hypothetical protein
MFDQYSIRKFKVKALLNMLFIPIIILHIYIRTFESAVIHFKPQNIFNICLRTVGFSDRT